MAVHSSVQHVLDFFSDHSHAAGNIRVLSDQFESIAGRIATNADGPEATVALRKLLEARDAAFRAIK